MISEVRQKLQAFLSRDYQQDAADLNKLLSRTPRRLVGFAADMPPVPFVGNPFDLKPTQCIAVIGINPRWRGWKDKWADLEYRDLKTCIDGFRAGSEAEFERFLQLRADYFSPTSRTYYGRYFTKLGGHIGRTWFGGSDSARPVELAKEVFRTRVLKTEFLPWFSENADGLDAGKIVNCTHAAVVEYLELLGLLIATARPRWIQCNGLTMANVVPKVMDLESPFERVPLQTRGRYILCCRARVSSLLHTTEPLTVPVMMHGFSNSRSGPNTRQEFREVASAFADWAQDEHLFEFEEHVSGATRRTSN